MCGFQLVFLETHRKHTSLLYNPRCSIFVICLFPFSLLMLLWMCLLVGLRVLGYCQCFFKEVVDSVVHFSTPKWFNSLWGTYPLFTHTIVNVVCVFTSSFLLFGCISTLLPRGLISRPKWHLEFQVHEDFIIIMLTHSKTILENTVEIESKPVALDFKNLSQYSSHSKSNCLLNFCCSYCNTNLLQSITKLFGYST